MNNLVSNTISKVVEGLKSIEDLQDSVFAVMTQEELERLATTLTSPAVGVMYSGIISRRTEDKQPTAAAAHLYLTIVLFYKEPGALGYVAGSEFAIKAVDLLDSIREYMKINDSFLGKPWLFMAETNPVEKGSLTVWQQTWMHAVIV